MRIALALLASVSLLSACGLRGDLVRPVPLWGNPPNEGANDPRTLKAQADAKAKADKEKAAAEKQQAQPTTPTPQ